MKILLIHNRYLSKHIGGEDLVYENELKLLQKKLGKENVYSYEVTNDDIDKFKLIFSIWFSRNYYKEVKQSIERNNIDIVHVHNFYPLLTPSIFKASKDAGAKVVHTLHNYRLWCISGIFYRDGYGICELCTKSKFSLHGIFNKCFRKSISQSILAQCSFWYYRITKVFNNIDYFFVLTDFQKEKVESLGVDTKKIILKPNSLHMNLEKHIDKHNYIYVGRLEESKGIYKLLKVWEKLDDKFILTVIGSGEKDDILHNRYNKKNIIFKGKCTREETLYQISKSKYLIQPSIWYETFGLTVIEALSCGVPVIGFNIGTRKNFIEDGINGFFMTEANIEDVIKKSFHYKEYKILSRNAMLTAQKFENNYIIEKQIGIYKDILKGNT